METWHLSLPAVRAWCERNQIRCLVNEKLGQIAIPRPLEPDMALRFIPRPERGMMTVAFPMPFVVPTDRQPEMREALSLANSSSFMGAWVLNGGKGEVYFRVTLPTEGVLYTDDGLRFVLQVVIGSAEGLVGRLRRVAAGEAAAASVIAQG
jgi:hypothetical protein